MDETKKCPDCAEEIPAEDNTCEYCGARFSVLRKGYCSECKEVVELGEGDTCGECGTETTDAFYESEKIEREPEEEAGRTAVEPEKETMIALAPAGKTPRARRSIAEYKSRNRKALAVIGLLFIVVVVIYTVVEHRPKSNEALIAQLKSTEIEKQIEAAQKLGANKAKSAVEPLVNLLSGKDANMHSVAATALGDIGDPKAVEPLINCIADPNQDDEVTQAAMESLKKIGKPAVVLIATYIVQKQPNALVTSDLGEVLAGIKVDRSCMDPLIGLLGHRDAGSYAVASLQKVVNKSDFDRFAGMLSNPDILVRFAAAQVLAKTGDPRVVDTLISAVQNEQLAITHIESIMRDIGPPCVASLLNSGLKADSILASIEKAHPGSVGPLTSLLDTNNISGIAAHYDFFIHLGRQGSEGALVSALNSYGNESMCTTYLNTGNQALEDAARQWASAHGYRITSTPGFTSGSWGK